MNIGLDAGRAGCAPGKRTLLGASNTQHHWWGGGGGWHKALVVDSVSLWRRLLASRL